MSFGSALRIKMEIISEFLMSIRWQDLLDIAVSSYILFRLYMLFWGTNVFRVVVGILFLLLFGGIAFQMGLVVTSWAIQGATAAGAIVIIVVFRNEIRSVLEAKNLRAIVWGLPSRTIDTPIDDITDAVFEMAHERCGAIIVFPGKIGVRDKVQIGIPWNGIISKEMLTSIFYHGNPVHDGAAIIQGDKVSTVKAILPLSRRTDLPTYYGTRHRAAAGLTEKTDALVVVVSEERGAVTVCKQSTIRRIHKKKDLMAELTTHERIVEGKVGNGKTGFSKVAIAAVVSVMAITGVWFNFTKGRDTLITVDAPIEFVNKAPDTEILRTSASTASLQLSGATALMRSVKSEYLVVRLDLRKAALGSNTFNIKAENIHLPPGITLKMVNPPRIEVILDTVATKDIPVQVDWAGQLPDDLLIHGVKIEPRTIQVTGLSKILDDISTIYTEKVYVDILTAIPGVPGRIDVSPILGHISLKVAPGSKDRIAVTYAAEKREPAR